MRGYLGQQPEHERSNGKVQANPGQRTVAREEKAVALFKERHQNEKRKETSTLEFGKRKIDGEDLGHKLRARDKSILSTLFRDMVKYLTPLLSMYREKTVI